jgi:hypothetical protein
MVDRQTRVQIEREMYNLRILLDKCVEGSHWEQRILARIAWLKEKLKELGDD